MFLRRPKSSGHSSKRIDESLVRGVITPMTIKRINDKAQGGIVVVAPMGTKPVDGGNINSVPAGTLSGFLMLFNSTNAGADKLKRSAMRYNVSPD